MEEKDTTGGKVKGPRPGSFFIVTLIDAESMSSVNAIMVEIGVSRAEKKGKWNKPMTMLQ